MKSYLSMLAAMFLLLPAGRYCCPAADRPEKPMAVHAGRRQIHLRDGWLVKQLDSTKPDVAALARESAPPDKTWLTARMPAQVHDVLVIVFSSALRGLNTESVTLEWRP